MNNVVGFPASCTLRKLSSLLNNVLFNLFFLFLISKRKPCCISIHSLVSPITYWNRGRITKQCRLIQNKYKFDSDNFQHWDYKAMSTTHTPSVLRNGKPIFGNLSHNKKGVSSDLWGQNKFDSYCVKFVTLFCNLMQHKVPLKKPFLMLQFGNAVGMLRKGHFCTGHMAQLDRLTRNQIHASYESLSFTPMESLRQTKKMYFHQYAYFSIWSIAFKHHSVSVDSGASLIGYLEGLIPQTLIQREGSLSGELLVFRKWKISSKQLALALALAR